MTLEEWARDAGELDALCPSIVLLGADDFEGAVLSPAEAGGDEPAIVHFFAREAPISKFAAAALEGVAQNGWRVFGIDCEAEASAPVAERFAIGTLPTILLFRGGKLLANYSGQLDKTLIGQWAVNYQ